ncbi:hypothetical protein ALC57_00797 [Trachymyrmex cornetzi]|uniref:Uncharacterized protein n=1 Tax=Trachymyrmex cornetzi TaxID=471704 RepID=A0A151JQV4_9HYME|nr:hypothetical protein ALC57_00797 [Trachymyrmex cornetzi]
MKEDAYRTVSIDGMSIKSHLYYNINKNEVIDLNDNSRAFKALRNMFLKYYFTFTEYHASFKAMLKPVLPHFHSVKNLCIGCTDCKSIIT